MAKFSLNQKAHRVLRFTMGLRDPRAYTALAQHGFTEDDLREGLERLAKVVRSQLAPRPERSSAGVVDELDTFESYWFPIVRASLARHYPRIGELLMENLSSASGIEVALAVATFLERFEALASGAAPFGPDGPEARALLHQRGLTDAVLAEVHAAMERVASFSSEQNADYAEDIAQAQEAMWAWYLEWSAIARRAIDSRGALRRLGFLQHTRTAADEAEDAEDIDVVDSVENPEPTTPALPAVATESSVGLVEAPQLAENALAAPTEEEPGEEPGDEPHLALEVDPEPSTFGLVASA